MMNVLPSFALVRNVVATIPLAILVHDNFFSFYRVRGSSMEPTLADGDIVVVRKADGLWQRWTRSWPPPTIVHSQKGILLLDPLPSCYAWAVERSHVLEYEREQCRFSPRTGWLRTPPVPVTGNIVVFQDPEMYPSKKNIKRVHGLGGQIVRERKMAFCVFFDLCGKIENVYFYFC
jgi:signal peptidase I